MGSPSNSGRASRRRRLAVRSLPGLGRMEGSAGGVVLVALCILYVVWGSTYLAIQVAIRTIPPLLMASIRFLVAGAILFAWSVRRGDRVDRVGPAQWRAAALVGGALLLGGNGGVVWAEHRHVPTGVVALIVASIPMWMALIDRVATGQRLARPAVVGLVLGFAGLALLVGRPGGSIDATGVGVALVAALLWSGGSVYARHAPLPSRPLVGAAMEMLAGGALLGVVAIAAGELGDVHVHSMSGKSLAALAYLVVFGSLVAFSAYAWLLGHARLSLVSTYAYVNPVVAVLLGWAILSEPVTGRVLFASAVIVGAVALIVAARTVPERLPPPTDAGPCEGPVAVAGSGATAADPRR